MKHYKNLFKTLFFIALCSLAEGAHITTDKLSLLTSSIVSSALGSTLLNARGLCSPHAVCFYKVLRSQTMVKFPSSHDKQPVFYCGQLLPIPTLLRVETSSHSAKNEDPQLPQGPLPPPNEAIYEICAQLLVIVGFFVLTLKFVEWRSDSRQR